VPWIIGLVAAITAWTLTHIVDRVTSAPLISYKLADLEIKRNADGSQTSSGSFLVQNLTRAVAFSQAHFQIVAGQALNPEGYSTPAEGSFIFQGENFVANVGILKEAQNAEKPTSALTYEVPEMQPRQAWRLSFAGLATEPNLALRMGHPPRVSDPSTPLGAGQSGETSPVNGEGGGLVAVQLMAVNWQTWLVEHELEILIVLAAGSGTLLFVSLFFL
jgi:hypothetical protein